MSRSLFIASAALLLASPAALLAAPADSQAETDTASTQSTATTDAKPAAAKPAKDPNRIVCRREQEIGSRLNTKKTCMTAAEWEAQRQTQATEVDRIQKARPLNGG